MIPPSLLQSSSYDNINFCPSEKEMETLYPKAIVNVVDIVLNSRVGLIFEGISIKSQRKVIQFKGKLLSV